MLSCPLCQSERIHKSRRQGVVEKTVMAMIFLRPFRCLRCDSRFFRWTFSANTQASRQATTRYSARSLRKNSLAK